MNQKQMLENLKELRAALWKHAAGSESITPAAWAESLDKAIETLERIRWRKVEEETPETGRYGFYDSLHEDVMDFVVTDSGGSYISTTGYFSRSNNPWCEASGTRVTHWAYLPEMPEEEEDNG